MPKSIGNTVRSEFEEVVLSEEPDQANEATSKSYVDGLITTTTTSLTDHISDTSTHGITSAIVGESETQTLSNKTLTTPVVTGSFGFSEGGYTMTVEHETLTEDQTISFPNVEIEPEDGDTNYIVYTLGEQLIKQKDFDELTTEIRSSTNSNRKAKFSLATPGSSTTTTITIPTADVSLGKVNTNETNIATNTTNISTNTTNIATNATNISTNTSSISTNSTNISTNSTNISTNASNLTAHEADTSTHGVTEIVGTSETQTLTNKTINASNNTITNIGDSQMTTGINANKIANGSVSNTEFQYINSLTSNVQTQINNHLSDTSTHGVSTICGLTETQTLTNKELTSPIINEILDPTNDSTVLSFSGVGPIAPVNYFTVGNADSGQNPTIIATSGTDANVNIEMRTKGSGDYSFKVGSTERVGISGQQLLISTGSSGSPSLAFLDETTTGIWRTTNTMRFGLQSTESFRINVSSQLVLVKAGSNGTPSLCFDDDADTGMYSSSANTIDFTCGGDEVLRLATAGASAVNSLQITNGTGVPIIETIGDGGNIPLDISTKGSGDINLQVGGTDVLRLSLDTSGDNYLKVTGGTADVTIETAGNESFVPLILNTKSTGEIFMQVGGTQKMQITNSLVESDVKHYFNSTFDSAAGSTSNHEWAIYLNAAPSGSWTGGFVMSSDDLLLASNRTGSASNTPAQLGNSGSWAAASQRSLKKDINEVTGVYENLKNIGVYNYRMKCEDTTVTRELEIGLIADEVVEYYPELVVNADKPDSNMAITYDRVSVLAIQGVKELGKKVEVLESTIQDLQDQVKVLQNSFAML